MTYDAAPGTRSASPEDDPLAPRLAEPARIAALAASGLLEGGAEEAFDRITRIAAEALAVPIALIGVVTHDREVLKSHVGLPGDRAQVPLSHSICKHVVAGGTPLLIHDAGRDPAFRDHPAVLEGGFVAYAGVPLDDAAGNCLGVLCVADGRPRRWTDREVRLLEDLAAVVTTELRLRAAAAGARRAEAEAAARRDYTEWLLNSLSDGVGVLDDEGRIVDVNDRLLEMTGFTHEEVVGSGFPYPFTERGDTDPEALARAGRELRRLEAANFPVMCRRADGSVFPAEVSTRRLPPAPGMPSGQVGILRDVTERRALERRVRESEEMHRSLVASIAEGVLLHDSAGVVRAANAAASALLGTTEEEILGTRARDLAIEHVDVHGRPLPVEEWPTIRALRTGEAVDGAIVGMRRPGAPGIAWLRVSAVPMASPWGECETAVVTTFADVTSLRQAEHDLRHSEERFRRLSDQAPVGIFVTDAAGACTWVSATWSRLSGLPLEDALGDGWASVVHPDDAARVGAEWRSCAAEGRAGHLEFRFRRPDGRALSVTASIAPMRDEAGAIEGFVGIVTDSTRDRFFDQSRELLCVLTPDGGFVRANPALQDLLGLSTDELAVRGMLDVVHPSDRDHMRGRLAAAAAGEDPPAFETRCRSADGTCRRFVWSVGQDPGAGHLHAIARDVTERRRAEETEAGLLRVASVVAGGRSPQALFHAVAAEVVGLLGADVATVFRFDGPEAVIVGAVGGLLRVGERAPVDGPGLMGRVHRTAAPAALCVRDLPEGHPVRRRYEEGGQEASIAVPVAVKGRLWGAIAASSRSPAAVAGGALGRLERFAHLVEAAISTAEARREIVEYAAEQSALRRVAVLVAREGEPAAVFELVAEEAAALLAAEACGILRIEPSRVEGRLLSWWSMPGVAAPPPGTAVRFRGGSLADVHVEALPGPAELAEWLLPDTPDEGIHVRSAAPVVVNGCLWGAVIVATSGALETGARERLERFAELVGLAIGSADARAQLAEMASTDHLTGLWNRRAFDERIELEVARARRQGRPLSLIVLDLDHFKDVNDTHGHQMGDHVLAELADRLRRISRAGEVVARVGGEEFAWLLPETDGRAAYQAAERARAAIAADRFPIVGHLTSSAGVCELANAGTASELFRLADLALYWAKAEGRDASFLYTPAALEVIHADEQARRLDRARALAAIQVLAQAVDARNPTTQRHSKRVAALAEDLALAQGWTPERAGMLHEAGLVHDVGKVGVPDAVLFKAGSLDDEEREQVRQHVGLGALMVGGSLAGEQVAWIRGHHERYDGQGYPDSLAAERIPEGARLLALADAWVAMTVARLHATPKSVEDAYDECRRQSGRQFCPSAVAALEELWRSRRDVLLPPGEDPQGPALPD